MQEEGGINLYQFTFNSPTHLIDPWGLAPGDKYPTADAAAKAALNDICKATKDKKHEHGGWIYKNADGTYSYDTPREGDRNGVEVGSPPAGTQGAGDLTPEKWT